MRVGLGYDLHPLKPGRPLVLGGVAIEHPRGLDGHSDADALTHAVIDALLGAAGLGDIGHLFPAEDPRYEGASSLSLLTTAVESLAAAGFRIGNVDATVIAQQPRLSGHLGLMRGNLARCLGVDESRVSVKATSPEGVGALGREEAIAAQAVAVVEDL